MKLKGYDITIKQGETFSIDYLLQNRDGSPYILPVKSNDPYFLLTVSSTKYTQEGRYIKNYWLKIADKNKFYVTQPIEISSFNSEPSLPEDETYSDLETYAVYYVVNDDGTKTYKRWLNNEWVDYELRISKVFTKSDTIEWIGQSYVYSIDYVDGVSMLTYLKELYFEEYKDTAPDNVEDLYSKLSEKSDHYRLIEYDRQLAVITITTPIISEAKISVISNIKGGII